jgi:Rrf2 family protein
MNLGLQRKTDLALRALRSLGVPGVRISGAALSSSIGTTTSFLPQVVAPLIEKGWVTSDRGPGGGYSLSEGSAGVSLFDVVEAVEGPSVDGRCVLRNQPCPGDNACEAHAVWTQARDVVIDGLRGVPAIPTGGEKK